MKERSAMTAIGYSLSSEEHPPADLVRFARKAEDAGFAFAMISDHYHPWTDRQGNSPFVWRVLGAIAQATTRLRVGTAVTCPTIRIHPAIIAQAAATTASLFDGRFFLGVGTGENLNEHILGDRWPAAAVRREMLEEAIAVMRLLWKGGLQSHSGRHYTVENARLYTLPRRPPEVYIAASGEESAEMAGSLGDGLIGVAPDAEIVKHFESAGGAGKPKLGQVKVCWARSEAEARKTATEWWPLIAAGGELNQELPLPRHFEQAVKHVTEDMVAGMIPCGPDPERHLAAIHKYVEAGYDQVFLHQVGPDQEGFFQFYRAEVLPRLSRTPVGAAKGG